MSYLYVTEHGAALSIDGGYFVVKSKNGLVQKIPMETLESVALFANVTITSPCTKEILQRGISLSYFSPTGAYFGRLESTRHINVFRLKKQVNLSENKEFRLEFTKKILKAKINNQIILLKRYLRTNNVDANKQIKEMSNAMKNLYNSENVEQCMGYEGLASRNYFQVLSMLVPSEFKFNGRSKRPPKDAFNSLLSLGYTMIMYEIYGELENKGLNPYVGFMHSDRERHPTLASDIMEEWRAVIVDSTVMSLVMGNEISIDNFITSNNEPGIFLDRTAMKIFLNKYDSKLRNGNKYLEYGTSEMSYRKCLWTQVSQLTKAIEENNLDYYKPVVIR